MDLSSLDTFALGNAQEPPTKKARGPPGKPARTRPLRSLNATETAKIERFYCRTEHETSTGLRPRAICLQCRDPRGFRWDRGATGQISHVNGRGKSTDAPAQANHLHNLMLLCTACNQNSAHGERMLNGGRGGGSHLDGIVGFHKDQPECDEIVHRVSSFLLRWAEETGRIDAVPHDADKQARVLEDVYGHREGTEDGGFQSKHVVRAFLAVERRRRQERQATRALTNATEACMQAERDVKIRAAEHRAAKQRLAVAQMKLAEAEEGMVRAKRK